MSYLRVEHSPAIVQGASQQQISEDIPSIDAVLRGVVRHVFLEDCRREVCSAVQELRRLSVNEIYSKSFKDIVLEKKNLKVEITLGIALSGVIQVDLKSSQTSKGVTQSNCNTFHILPVEGCRAGPFPVLTSGPNDANLLTNPGRSYQLCIADQFMSNVYQMHSPLTAWHQRLTQSKQYTLNRQFKLLIGLAGLAQGVDKMHQASWTIGNLCAENLMIIDAAYRVVISNLSTAVKTYESKKTPIEDCEDLLKVIGGLYLPGFSSILPEIKPQGSLADSHWQVNSLKKRQFKTEKEIKAQIKEKLAALQEALSNKHNEISTDGQVVWSKCLYTDEISNLKKEIAQKETALASLQTVVKFRKDIFSLVVWNLSCSVHLSASSINRGLIRIHADFRV